MHGVSCGKQPRFPPVEIKFQVKCGMECGWVGAQDVLNMNHTEYDLQFMVLLRESTIVSLFFVLGWKYELRQ